MNINFISPNTIFEMRGKMDYQKNMQKYAKKRNKKISEILRQDFQANLSDFQHKMLVERESLDSVYQDLSCLERIELEDFWQKENND